MKKNYVLPTTYYLLALLTFLLLPQLAFAVEAKLQIPIPGFQVSEQIARTDPETGLLASDLLPQYISAIYSYLVGFASLFATALIMYGGMKWIFAGGDSGKISKAKEVIQHAVIGLVLALGSYLVLYTLNPALVDFNALQLTKVERVLVNVDEAQATIGESGVGTGDVPYFGQYDSEWAQIKPGDSEWPFSVPGGQTCTTIIQRGCGTTSLAMVLKSYGFDTDPLETAKWGLGCTGGWQPRLTLENLSKRWADMKGEIIYKNNINKVFDILRAGEPVIYNCAPCSGYLTDGSIQPRPYRGHYMVLTAIDDQGRILVNDPGRGTTRRTAYFTEEQIRNEFNMAVYIHPEANP